MMAKGIKTQIEDCKDFEPLTIEKINQVMGDIFRSRASYQSVNTFEEIIFLDAEDFDKFLICLALCSYSEDSYERKTKSLKFLGAGVWNSGSRDFIVSTYNIFRKPVIEFSMWQSCKTKGITIRTNKDLRLCGDSECPSCSELARIVTETSKEGLSSITPKSFRKKSRCELRNIMNFDVETGRCYNPKCLICNNII